MHVIGFDWRKGARKEAYTEHKETGSILVLYISFDCISFLFWTMPDFISRHYYNTLSKATNVCTCTILKLA